MIIVSDTTAISSLFKINRLDLLRQLYFKVLIPDAVMNELLQLENRGLDLSVIKSADWIEVVRVSNTSLVNNLLSEIDLGESEAIILAQELKADWLLIDEAKGRRIAHNYGISIVGLLGILLKAKDVGIINNCSEILEELIATAKFRVKEDLKIKFLELAGE